MGRRGQSAAGEVGRDLFIWRELAPDLDLAASKAAEFIRREMADV